MNSLTFYLGYLTIRISLKICMQVDLSILSSGNMLDR